LDELLDLSMEDLYSIYKGVLKKDARDSLDRMYGTALAFGGTKDSITKYTKPYIDLLNDGQSQEYDELDKTTQELSKLFS